MAATITTPPPVNRKPKACFSFAAYSKDLISHLHHHSNVPIAHGLTNKELSTIESSFNFSFPPDLRSILRESLPIGQGFSNWRSSSHQQLDILVNLPILGICKEVCRKKFWFCHWGDRPEDNDEAVGLAKRWLTRSPVLVPVYRNCYIPTIPRGEWNAIRASFECACVGGYRGKKDRVLDGDGRNLSCGDGEEVVGGSELGRCLESVRVKLRDGGWKEKDLDEMMVVAESESSPPSSVWSWSSSSSEDDHDARETVVRILSRRLLRGDGVWEMWWNLLVV
ncbi:uncharacterized protein LOC143626384 [Bidens hawaiensis]|uniref:uncharacterized protein LOC143626384 n=1 Tax=Bidens hawaiensis TaxID=980011 RepID=UPI0040496BD9